MILKDYLLNAYDLRNPPITYSDHKTVFRDSNQINEAIRTEYEFLCKRLYMLFGVFPNFAHPPHLNCIEEEQTIKYDENGFEEGIVERWIEEAKAKHDEIGVEYIEDTYKIVSIFWCVVFWYIEDVETNKKQIDRGYKITLKSSKAKGYSNKEERRRSYEYFFSCFPNKLEDTYRFFCQKDSYNVIPYDILQLPLNILAIIKSDKFLLECFQNTENAISLFNRYINKEYDKNNEMLFDGYIEDKGETYRCEISDYEKELFDYLATLIESRSVVDAISWHNDWRVIDSAERKKIIGYISEIIKNDDLSVINRYVSAKSINELKEKLSCVEDKLENPDLYVFEEKLYKKKKKDIGCID